MLLYQVIYWACYGVVCLVKENVRIFGSACEMFEVKWNLKKPVYLISALDYDQMNPWEIGLSDEIFRNTVEAVEFLRKLS